MSVIYWIAVVYVGIILLFVIIYIGIWLTDYVLMAISPLYRIKKRIRRIRRIKRRRKEYQIELLRDTQGNGEAKGK